MYDTATNTDMFYVEGVIFEPLEPYIGSSGDPRGMGSHNDYMIHDIDGNSIKVRMNSRLSSVRTGVLIQFLWNDHWSSLCR